MHGMGAGFKSAPGGFCVPAFSLSPSEFKQSSHAKAYQVSKSNDRVASVPVGTHHLALAAYSFIHFFLSSDICIQTPKHTCLLWYHTYKCVQAASIHTPT